MSLKVQFGTGGNADLKKFTDEAEGNALNADPLYKASGDLGTEFGQAAQVVEGTVLAPGGTVNIQYTEAKNAFTFDVAGDWNSVKNFSATSDNVENLTIKDFVHVDVKLGGAAGDVSSIHIHNAKRGNVETGASNDTIWVSLLNNDKTWQGDFYVDSGAGNDTITFARGDTATAGDGVGSWITGANGSKAVTDGSATTVYINAGAGNDTVDLSAVKLKSSFVTGGTGKDLLIASGGADTFIFAQGDTGTTWGSADVVQGFGATDKLDLYGAKADWTVTYEDGENLLRNINTNERIIVEGVNLNTLPDWFI